MGERFMVTNRHYRGAECHLIAKKNTTSASYIADIADDAQERTRPRPSRLGRIDSSTVK